MKFLFGLILVLIFLFFGLGPKLVEKRINQVSEHNPYSISDEASNLHADLFIGDWHADSTLWNRNLINENEYGHVDIPRLQKGNVSLQMFTTVSKSPSGLNYEKNSGESSDSITALTIIQRWPLKTWNNLTERVIYQAQKLHNFAKNDHDNFMLIFSKRDLNNYLERKKSKPSLVGGLIGTEGSHALEGNIKNIERLYEEGFRMMSLHHFFDNKLGGSLHGLSGDGLSNFGIDAINEMIRLGIMIDVSHSSEKVVEDVLRITNQPLLVSHTGLYGHCQSSRNISDVLMQKIASKGGLIGIGYWNGAVCGNTPKAIADAIRYGIDLVGSNHIALGSDFDGAVMPAFDTSELSALTQELISIGISEDDIRLVMGDNMLRFLNDNLPNNSN
jgi:microsomal dipeptidase-like Zn-dependent dipeptidase